MTEVNENGPKHEILTKFLDFVTSRVPLLEAVLATMGGRGHEMELWKTAGIPSENGWLIERNRRLSAQIIRSRYFRYCANLQSFAGILKTVKGAKNAFVDGFHLDLCGTLEPRFDDFKAIPGLIMKSRGRCLAITVADERRNTTLEHWEQVCLSAQGSLGERDSLVFLEWLTREQKHLRATTGGSFEPTCGMKRELGLFLNVLLLLKKLRGSKIPLPDAIQRYVYVSTEYGYSFRMRTYFFHFGNKFVSRDRAARRLMKLWQKSGLYFFGDNQFQKLEVPKPVPQPTEDPMTATEIQTQVLTDPSFSKLRQIAEVAGGEILEQFLAFHRAVEAADEAIALVRKFRELLNGQSAGSTQPAETQVVQPARIRVQQREIPVESSTEAKSDLDVKLNLLRAAAVGKETLEEAYKQAYQDLGLTGRRYTQTRRRKVGAMYAWTQGRFRKRFVKACIGSFGSEILVELAGLYSAITGETVMPSELEREASA